MGRVFSATAVCAICAATFTARSSRPKYCLSCVAEGAARKNRIYRVRYRRVNPESPQQKRAWKEVENAVKYGKLIRPICCERCRRTAAVQAHHHLGYDREHWLDVLWLCPPCHKRVHREAEAA